MRLAAQPAGEHARRKYVAGARGVHDRRGPGLPGHDPVGRAVEQGSALGAALEHDRLQPSPRQDAQGLGFGQLHLVLAEEQGFDPGQEPLPCCEGVRAQQHVRIQRDEAVGVGGQRRDERLLHVEGHRREVECASVTPGCRNSAGSRRHLGVGRAVEPVDDLAADPLVEQPRPEPGPAQGRNSLERNPAAGQALERRGGVLVAAHGDDPDAEPPQPGAESHIQGGSAGLGHASATVGQHHVVHQQVAEHDEVEPHAGRRKRRRAASACSRTPQPSRWSFTRPIACMNA